MRRDEASIFATIRPELALDRLNGPINAVPAIFGGFNPGGDLPGPYLRWRGRK